MLTFLQIRAVNINDPTPIEEFFKDDEEAAINDDGEGKSVREKAEDVVKELNDIGKLITDGAIQFLIAEYTYLGIFCLVFALIIGFTVDLHEMKTGMVEGVE